MRKNKHKDMNPSGWNLSEMMRLAHMLEFGLAALFCLAVFVGTYGAAILTDGKLDPVKDKTLLKNANEFLNHGQHYMMVISVLLIAVIIFVIAMKKKAREKRIENRDLIMREIQQYGYRITDIKIKGDNTVIEIRKDRKTGDDFVRQFWL